MKKKNAVMVLTMVLTLAMSGTCVACGSEQKEQKQESTTEVKDVEKKTTDNKKENEKVQENVLSDAKVDTVEANTENESEAENVASTNETSNNGNGNTGNASVTNASSGNHTGNSGSVSSGSNTGSSTGNSSGNSSASATSSGNNTNNSNSNNNSNSGPAQTAHTHTWVHVEATGHYETVVVQDAWDEEVPVYENVAHDICNQCGADITGNTTEHNMKHALAYEPGGWHTEWRYEQTGTQKVHHDAVTEQRWVQDSPAYDVCSGCGATK